MKRPLLLSLICLALMQPAQAGKFEDLKAARAKVFQSIISGGATDEDVDRFKKLDAQIKALITEEFEKQTTQQQSLMDSLGRLETQQSNLHATLFGKVEHNMKLETVITAPPEGEKMKVGPIILDKELPDIPEEAGQVQPLKLKGSLEQIDYHKVTDLAMQNSEDLKTVSSQLEKYNGKYEKVKAFTAEAMTFFVPYRGFSQSRDGSLILQGKEMKVNSISSAQLRQLQLIDRIHLKLVTSILQVAECLGKNDASGAEKGMMFLRPMIGKEQAETLKSQLASSSLDETETLPKEDVMTGQDRYKALLKSVVEKDQLSNMLVEKIRKLQPSGKSMITSRVVSTTLGILEMGPWWMGLPARGVYATYSMATGGQESSKLLKEICLGKALESRVDLLDDEVRIVTQYHAKALREKNAPLLSATKSLLAEMTQ